jgi:hypothetical protein
MYFNNVRCIMSLIQGIKCLWLCPVCLVPYDELLNTLKSYPCETSAQSQEILNAAWAKRKAEEKEEKLEEYGLRDITVRFPPLNLFLLNKDTECLCDHDVY